MKNIEQQALFEIVMSIGSGTDSRSMMHNSLTVMIRKLGCNLAVIVNSKEGSSGIVYSIPYHLKSSAKLLSLCQQGVLESVATTNPLHLSVDDCNLVAFKMSGYGLMVLGKKGPPFSKMVLGNLVRIAEKLSSACIYYDQAEIIKDEQEHFKLLESRYRFLFNSSPLPIWVIDARSLRFLNVNDRAVGHYGYSREEFSRMTLADIRPKETIPDMFRLISSSTDGNIKGEMLHRKKDGTIINVEVNSVSINYDGIPARIGIIQDFTERKRISLELERNTKRLRDLVANYEAVQETERKSIASEVHDELGQILSTLRFNISMINKRFGQNHPDLAEMIQNMTELVDRAIHGVRNVSENLHPAVLRFGIYVSIKWLCERFNAQFNIPCRFDSADPGVELEDARAIVIFRIVQESMTNVIRHSNASYIQVSLNVIAGDLYVDVHDDGRGFDMNMSKARKTFGLFGMDERARSVGADLTINSVVNVGTTISIRIPINSSANIL